MYGPRITGSAAMHAERIKAREAARAKAADERDNRPTHEVYAERAAAGARADEALRERARMDELRARGVISDDSEPDEAEEYDVEEYEEEVVEDDDEEGQPVSTAELYARRERERQKAEHAVNVRAQTGAVRAMGQPVWPQYPVPVKPPHRYADRL
ncbi:hypothetical protein ACFWN1_26490 [Streptomyces sp. NPDC058459]|uniref:hypothetical protein n=1 Tax=Streptomyces sp. NPDC058459 TaxID=3346508 RepID=UPI00365A8678